MEDQTYLEYILEFRLSEIGLLNNWRYLVEPIINQRTSEYTNEIIMKNNIQNNIENYNMQTYE